CLPGSNAVRTKRGPSKRIHEGPPCPCCGRPRGGRRSWAVGWFSGLAKPPWQPEYPVPELPYVRGLEAHPRGSRVRSQHNEISASRLAPGGGLYPVSCQAGVLEYRNELCRLPRRPSSPANGGWLRTVPYRQRMEHRFAAGDGTRQSFPSCGSAC